MTATSDLAALTYSEQRGRGRSPRSRAAGLQCDPSGGVFSGQQHRKQSALSCQEDEELVAGPEVCS